MKEVSERETSRHGTYSSDETEMKDKEHDTFERSDFCTGSYYVHWSCLTKNMLNNK